MTANEAWKRDVLARVNPFKACNARQLDEFARLADERALEPAGVLCCEGDMGDDTYVIVDGVLQISVRGEAIATLGAGEIVGEQALLNHGRRNATVTALTHVTLLVIDAREVDAMLAAVPGVARSYGVRSRATAESVAAVVS
jgi:CRP-like cAMP-binding protein